MPNQRDPKKKRVVVHASETERHQIQELVQLLGEPDITSLIKRLIRERWQELHKDPIEKKVTTVTAKQIKTLKIDNRD